MSILVILEQSGGKWNRMSFEALAAAQKDAQAQNVAVEGAVLGAEIGNLAKEAAAYPLSKVHVLEHPLLSAYTADGYTSALEQLIKSSQPGAVLFPHTYQARDYAPKLATRLGKTLISDIVDA